MLVGLQPNGFGNSGRLRSQQEKCTLLSRFVQAKYEEAVDRQLKMVDKLLADKSELTKKCDALTEEMKQAEKKFQDKLEDQAHHFQREAERQKRALLNAEKVCKSAGLQCDSRPAAWPVWWRRVVGVWSTNSSRRNKWCPG